MFSRMNRVKSDWRNRLKRDTPDWWRQPIRKWL
jgi:hypothetical protein